MEKTTNKKHEEAIELKDLSQEELREILDGLSDYVRRAAYPVGHPQFTKVWRLLTIWNRKVQLKNLLRLRNYLLKRPKTQLRKPLPKIKAAGFLPLATGSKKPEASSQQPNPNS